MSKTLEQLESLGLTKEALAIVKEVQESRKNRRQQAMEEGYTLEEIDYYWGSAELGDIISDLIVQAEHLEGEVSYLKEKHCFDCCKCEECNRKRLEWAEEEAELEAERFAEERQYMTEYAEEYND